MTYKEFLQTKIAVAPTSGFEITDADINPALKPHQRDSVRWAIAGGRRAIFAKFGLGKTVMELEYCRIVTDRLDGPALITLPLGVKQEFTRDAVNLLGWKKPPPYIRTMAEARAAYEAGHKIMLTNYERVRDGDIDLSYFVAASLDEAAVLRSYGSDTYQTFLPKFAGVKYKLVATAVPSPNRYKELIHYAGFLEIMDTGQALTRFFKRDSTKANNLTLYPHMEEQFWLWVSSWALFLTKPSDLGYSDDGYDLPPLEIRYHKIGNDGKTVVDRDGQVMLMRETSSSLPDAAAEKRNSIDARVQVAREIVEAALADHFVIWHDLNKELDAIQREIPEAVGIKGEGLSIEEREQRTIDFSEGRFRILATKKSLSGSGCNFQHHCHRAIFVGIDHKFHDFIQAVHRLYRFLQAEPVEIDIIYTEAEAEILRDLMEKWKRHDEMAEKMQAIVKQYGLVANAVQALSRKMGVERTEVNGSYYTAVNNDCVEELAAMPDNTMDLWHTSIPFGNHYEYTANYNDFGYNKDTEQFFQQLDFLTPHVLRTLKPGRVLAVHVKDRVLFGNATGTGTPTIEPFHAFCISHYMKHGFLLAGMITVVTDVVRENNQTYRLSWSAMLKDGAKMGVGCNEYILLFRKQQTDTSRAFADEPVVKTPEEYGLGRWQIDASPYWRSSGDRLVSTQDLIGMVDAGRMGEMQKLFHDCSQNEVYDYHKHIALAEELSAADALPKSHMAIGPASVHPDVWDDVTRMQTLNTTQSSRRKALHVCPLQLDIVERIIFRYSNPGELVGDFFAGLMTVPYMAVKMDRHGWGCELNSSYFRDGVEHLESAEAQKDTPTLFDLIAGKGA